MTTSYPLLSLCHPAALLPMCSNLAMDSPQASSGAASSCGSPSTATTPPASAAAAEDDIISVGCPSPAAAAARSASTDDDDEDSLDAAAAAPDDYFRPLKRLKMLRIDGPRPRLGGVKSFSIQDILSHRPSAAAAAAASAAAVRIVRPWALADAPRPPPPPPPALQRRCCRPRSADEALSSTTCSSGRSSAASDCCSPDAGAAAVTAPRRRGKGANTSPLDALFQMTSKTFEELSGETASDGQGSHLNLFNNRQQVKKKRKSRTAFTNHQIFELEKRFLYQKYLSPADRDEIAGQLGLSNAQVITWFQNRRAKLKRDMEELKKDVENTKILTAHKSFLENVQDLGILKKKSGSSATSCDDKVTAALAVASEK